MTVAHSLFGCCTCNPRLHVSAADACSQAEQFFREPATTKALYRYATASDELKHGWFAELNREYFEVHRVIGSTTSLLDVGVDGGGAAGGSATADDLPYPSDEFRKAADATFSILERVAHCALKLLLSERNMRDNGESNVASDVHSWSAGEDSHVYRVDDSSTRDSERKHLLGASHVAVDPQATAMSHAAVRRTLLDGMPVDAEEGALEAIEEIRCSAAGDGGRTVIQPEAGEVPRLRQQPSRSALSTSMFRIHQYNSSDESLRGSRVSAMQLALGLRRHLQGLLRRLPCHALLSTLVSGTTGGVCKRIFLGANMPLRTRSHSL